MADGTVAKRQILVPGGQGFIGSHCVIELIKAGYEPIVVDNHSNSSSGTMISTTSENHRTIYL